MTHPTPTEIQLAILRRFNADRRSGDPKDLPVPVRVFSLIEKGIQDACEGVTQ